MSDPSETWTCTDCTLIMRINGVIRKDCNVWGCVNYGQRVEAPAERETATHVRCTFIGRRFYKHSADCPDPSATEVPVDFFGPPFGPPREPRMSSVSIIENQRDEEHRSAVYWRGECRKAQAKLEAVQPLAEAAKSWAIMQLPEEDTIEARSLREALAAWDDAKGGE